MALLAAEGVDNHEIARRLEISRNQAIEWRKRFAQDGVAATSSDLPRSGRNPRIDAPGSCRRRPRRCPRVPPIGARAPWPPSWVCPIPPCSRSGTPAGSSRT
ncbi:MAG: helix-turn-helix domain-containing protein [Rhodanobacter sp.]|nr:MAG: helix-turn-helix domain-containing protein [Rhodanobacter sp.]TAL89802.1 MAG: helix-turn-helix domain-containing protein [Rhodanobacter sp.]TAM42921.1 MAG: helix-turn-helix domain-containing protein [Rhodanobacter sp.]